jgi:hypothetical protein
VDKPKTSQPQTPNKVQKRDLFQTPAYATKLIIPFIPKHIIQIWECACGSDKMANVFRSYGYKVFSSDITHSVNNINFLTDAVPDQLILDWNSTMIITNPAFSLKKKFFEKCIEYNIPFGLLIPFDMNMWICDAFDKYSCQGLVPNRRINFITPSGKSGKDSAAQFHSFWLTRHCNLLNQLTIVNLPREAMLDI